MAVIINSGVVRLIVWSEDAMLDQRTNVEATQRGAERFLVVALVGGETEQIARVPAECGLDVAVTMARNFAREQRDGDVPSANNTTGQSSLPQFTWDGRGTRSPAQLTDDLNDLDHRIDATDDRLTKRIDAIESKLQKAIRTQALAERARSRFRRLAKLAGYIGLAALLGYLLVLIWVVLSAPELLTSVLIGGIGAILGVAASIGGAVYARTVSH